MKSFSKRKGWLYNLVDGPYQGAEYRSGWMLPNGDRVPVDTELTFHTGVVYRLHQARWRSKSGTHSKDDMKFTKDGSPYMEYQWVVGSGE